MPLSSISRRRDQRRSFLCRFLQYVLSNRSSRSKLSRQHPSHSASGFTLIEMMVVVMLAGLLAALASP
ncbi:MAG TPA: prepilin-type N-terminal cleavage/methylation domain-containing protein, partial [Allocoleopsis sp.]